MIRLRFLIAFAFALALMACGDDSSPNDCPESQVCGEACCAANETCVAGVCQPEAQCDAGQISCDAACCDDATEICDDGACVCKTPCGDTCCGDREACDTSGACAPCELAQELSNFAALSGAADFAPKTGARGELPIAFMSADLRSGEATVRLFLRQGYDAFAPDIRTGTFVIEGDRLDFARCDICVLLTVYDSNREVVAEYMASGGEVDLTEFSPENGIKATLRDVTFRQVDIQWDDFNAMEPSPTNCTTSVVQATIGGRFPPQCDPMNPVACDARSSCQFWSELGFVCRTSGRMGEGEACTWGYDCLPGLDCLDAQPAWQVPGICVEVCKEKSTCDFVGTCKDFDHYLAGHCVECSETQTCDSVCCEDHQSCESDVCVDKPCPIDPSLGEFDGALLTKDAYTFQVPVPSADGSPDILHIFTYNWESRFQPGTYELGGLDYNTCGPSVCVMLLAYDAAGAEAGTYFATGGYVEIDSVDEGISAILHDVGFRQIQVRNDGTAVPHPQGCTTSLTTATVSATLCGFTPAQVCGTICCPTSEYCDVFAEVPACNAVTTPSNDTCGTDGANAIALTLDAPSVVGQTIGATADYGFPPDSCGVWYDAGGPEVVYSYTPDTDGTFYATVEPNSEFNPTLWVATGACGDGTTCLGIGVTDDGGTETGRARSLAIEGIAGVKYYIYVDHYTADIYGAEYAGVFKIGVTSVAP